MKGSGCVQNLILNRYRPLEKAGSGGFATVLAAWDTRIQRKVAIKCLRLDGCGTASSPTSARDIPGLDEARTAAMLSDSHIVGVYDFAVQGGVAYLIMEYMDGMTLTELMHQEGELSLDVATCVLESVARALEVAHANQVLHLDIKPDNVLINQQGQVKVTDFGLAQLSHEAGYGRAAGGTIGYMPLEQMRLEAPDERTDEWALASLTYEMLLGENPFRAQDLSSAQRAIEDAEIVIPSLAREDLDEEIDEALFGALAIDREDRFETVALFADAMLAHMGDARRGERELMMLLSDVFEDGDEPDAAFESEAESEELGDGNVADGAWRAEGDERPSVRGHGRGRLGGLVPRLCASLASCFAIGLAVVNSPVADVIAGQEVAVLLLAAAALLTVCAAFPLVGGVCVVAAWAASLLAGGSYALGAACLAAGALWFLIRKDGGAVRKVLAVAVALVVLVAGALLQAFFVGGVEAVPALHEWISVAAVGAVLALVTFALPKRRRA